MMLQVKGLVWEQNKLIFALTIFMLLAGCAKSTLPLSKALVGIDSIDIRGNDLTYDRFAPRNYEVCKGSLCWDAPFQFYIFIRDKKDIDTLITSLSKAKLITPDYDYGVYDYIFCFYKGKKRKYVYVSSSGILYLGDKKIRYSKDIHELIIVLIGEDGYNGEMNIPDEWLYSKSKDKHPNFPHVVPSRYQRGR